MQTLRSKLRERGIFRLMPKTLAFMAVQRQTAASRSVRPAMRVQHGVFGGVPTTTPSRPPSKSAHIPNFRASRGHVAFAGVGLGVGFGFGLGLGGLGVGQVPQEETRAKKRRLSKRKRAIDAELLESAISDQLLVLR